jgi:hypothetical protein
VGKNVKRQEVQQAMQKSERGKKERLICRAVHVWCLAGGMLVAGAILPPDSLQAADTIPLSEIKGGAVVHDLWRNHESKTREENTIDINLELLSKPLGLFSDQDKFLNALVNPRIHLGGDINTSGYTNKVYLGLTWDYQSETGIFAEFAFGMGVHDGKLKWRRPPDGRPSLGSPVVFREGLDIGYRFSSGHSLAVHGSHISHGGMFAKENDGMDFVGLRYGYRLD